MSNIDYEFVHTPDRLRDQAANFLGLVAVLIFATWAAVIIPLAVLIWRAAF